MKTTTSLVGTLAVVCGMTLPVALGQLRAETAAERLPVDLARGSLGARLQVNAPKNSAAPAAADDANRSAQGLISDDASLSYPLAQGNTTMILSLRKADVLSRMNFINYGAAGKLTIAASATKLPAESSDWHPVAKGQSFNGDGVVGCDLGSLEARYLKIEFQTQNPGRISGLGVFGMLTINSLDPHPASVYMRTANPGVNTPAGVQGGDVYFDYANLNTGAKVVGVSGGGNVSRAQAMLDGNVETDYAFAPSDPSPTVVVDLSARRALNRVSCVYQAPAGRIDFYLVDNPYTSDYQRSVSVSYVSAPTSEPAAMTASEYHRASNAERKAVCSVQTSDAGGISHASADISGASGRFLVAEFHPVANAAPKRGDFKDFKDFKDTPDFKDFKDTGVEGKPFKLISLSAFGDNPSSDTISRIPNIPPPPVQPPSGGTAQPPVAPPSSGTNVVTP